MRVVAWIAVVLALLAGTPAFAAREVLPEGARPARYDLDIVADPARNTFSGTARIEVQTDRQLSQIVLNAADLTITRATIDGMVVASRVDAEAQTLTLSPTLPLPRGTHQIAINYSGRVYEDAYGLFRSTYREGRNDRALLVTQFEPGDARRFAPMFDQPDMKAVFGVTVTSPRAMSAVSNMPVLETTRVGRSVRTRFADTPLMSSYLLFVGIGDFERVTTHAAGVEISVVTRRGEAEKGRFALESAAQVLAYYNDYFGTPYPLPKLDMIAAPGAGGFWAMENWGAILYFDDAVLIDPALSDTQDRINVFNTVAHEIAHQWFGNLVTMQWWDDLWLNEGFASWMAQRATASLHPEWSAWLLAAGERDGAMDQDSRAGTHPVVQQVDTIAQANLAFDDITYNKGQAIIRMVESYMGEAAFRDGMRAYIAAHPYGNTTTRDLWTALEGASHTPIAAIAQTFTDQEGAPLVRVAAQPCRRRDRDTTLQITQERFAADATSRTTARWSIPLRVRALGSTQEATPIVSEASARVVAPGACGAAIVNAGQGGYMRVLYADADLAQLRAAFATLAPVDQLGLVQDYWAHGLAGYAPLADFLAFAEAAPANADPLVAREVADSLDALRRRNAGRASQPALVAMIQRTLAPRLAALGWDARAGEPANTELARAALILALGRAGDPAVSAEARRRALSPDPALLPVSLRDPILRVAAAQADAATYDALLSRARAATTFIEQDQLYGVLTEVQDAALAQRTLALALDEGVPRALRAQIVLQVSRVNAGAAWDFLVTHRAAVESTLDPLRRYVFAPDVAARLDDDGRVAELHAYAATFPEDARQGVDAAAAQIAYNAEVRARRLPGIDGALGGVGAGAH